MAKFEVPWSAFGIVVVEAEDSNDAIEEALVYLGNSLGTDYDGIDLDDPMPAALWQTPVN